MLSCPILIATKSHLLTYCPSCHRQLGQQHILSISGGVEPVSVRFPMNVPWLSPLSQQYVSMSSLDARVFCVPLVSIRLLLLGWSLDLCVIYGLYISSVYVQLWLTETSPALNWRLVVFIDIKTLFIWTRRTEVVAHENNSLKQSNPKY